MECVRCKGSLGVGFGFDAQLGGVVCRRCAQQATTLPLSDAARSAMIGLMRGAHPELNRVLGDEIARALDAFLRAHVPRYRRLRSLDLVRAASPGD
jgi:recombinational DNA repair protein (RecF pathway)